MKDSRYYVKPFLVYVGNKSWFQEFAWKFYSRASKDRGENLTWVDPFCGSCALPLYIMPERAWLNDHSVHLINLYRYISEYGKMPDITDNDTKENYYAKRARFNEKIAVNEINDDEMAVLFYYLNRAGYGGLSRYNSKGGFNVPYRGHVSNSKTDFSSEQEAIRDWKFSNLIWEDVLDDLETDNDFLFIDPPYDEVFNKYIQKSFGWDQQVALAEKLASLPNPIVATNSCTDRIIELYTGLGFDVQYRYRGNMMQRPKVNNGVHKDFKEAIFTKNIQVGDNKD